MGGDVWELPLRNAPRRFTGLSLDQVAVRVLELHSRYRQGGEFPGGFYKHRGKGSLHITGPGVVLSLQKAVRSGLESDWDHYVAQILDRPPSVIRDLLEFAPRTPVPLEEVEPAERIMRRFVSSAMSHGSL